MLHSLFPIDCLNGYVTVRNEAGQESQGKNLVTYQGGDIIAQLLAGNVAYKIAYFGFEFQNTAGTPAPSPAARTDNNASLIALTGSFDYLRGALIAAPTFSAGDGNHTANQVTFTALSTASTGVHGVTFSAGSNSKIYAVNLLAAPTGAYTGDLVYARYILGTALPAVGSGQVTGSWMAEAR